VKTFDMPLLKTKDLPARYPLNCESRASNNTVHLSRNLW
jgi:hypothetical protein